MLGMQRHRVRIQSRPELRMVHLQHFGAMMEIASFACTKCITLHVRLKACKRQLLHREQSRKVDGAQQLDLQVWRQNPLLSPRSTTL